MKVIGDEIGIKTDFFRTVMITKCKYYLINTLYNESNEVFTPTHVLRFTRILFWKAPVYFYPIFIIHFVCTLWEYFYTLRFCIPFKEYPETIPILFSNKNCSFSHKLADDIFKNVDVSKFVNLNNLFWVL